MQTAKEYLESLSPELADKVKIKIVDHYLGGAHTNTDPKDDCRCTHSTPNGHCAVIDGNCVWVPEIG